MLRKYSVKIDSLHYSYSLALDSRFSCQYHVYLLKAAYLTHFTSPYCCHHNTSSCPGRKLIDPSLILVVNSNPNVLVLASF